jgi:hypothetical protein
MTSLAFTIAALLAAAPAASPKPAPAPAPVAVKTTSLEAAPLTSSEKKVRFRLGLLGGLSMQKTDLELAAGYDFLKLGEKLRLVGDLTVGLRPTEVTFEPMAGVRVPIALAQAPKLDLYFEALAGVNLTLLRGGVGVAIPFRVGAGVDYQVAPGLGVGCALGLEAGPLVAPFAAPYGAVHFGAMLAWTP